MNLEGVLADVAGWDAAQGALQVQGLAYDSRRVKPGDLFFAFAGATVDGRAYAAEALEKGAVAVVSELEAPEGFSGPWIRVHHGRQALARACRRFFGAPEEWMALTGITGTNGKTTTSYLIDAVLRAAGHITGLVGTIEYHVAGRVLPALNTTPESLELYLLFEELKKEGGTRATMEVSSHALALGRAFGLWFHTAVFTNFTRDHLDFHGDMESYFQAKAELFRGQGAAPPAWAVINWDDEWGRRIPMGAETRVVTYGLGEGGMVRAVNVASTFEGLRFGVEYEGKTREIHSPLVGHINVYNILAAYGCGLSFGMKHEQIAEGIAMLDAVPGRFERVEVGQPFLVVVDYAHTDDALRNVLRVARDLKPKRVLTLFGCGGDRDRTKRPLMAMAAAENSDFVALTSDNPRSEDPVSIINDALVGLRKYDVPHVIEVDREKAIRRVLEEAQPGDLVLLAGKGHEPYQVLKDRTIHFDDREVARAILEGFGYRKKRSV